MPIGTVVPPDVRPDEAPLVCVTLNQTWLSYVLGAILPMKYPEYWSGTLAENRQARRDYGTLLDMLMQESECQGMTICCYPPYVIQRVNPTTGMVEVSTDNGASWMPQSGSIPSQIIEPVPPVTSGVSATKCDAVFNLMGRIQAWIDHVTNDFDTAADATAFVSAVLEAILVAVLSILSLGTLTAIEAAVIPLIAAAGAAAWAEGKTAFVDYWTTDIKKKIRCFAYANVGDNGSMTDAQFSNFWSQCNLGLAGGLAKPLFIGFLSSIGRQGVNAMLANGNSSGSSCADCSGTCHTDDWAIGVGTEISRTSDTLTVQTALTGGLQVVNVSTNDKTKCCVVNVGTVGWGAFGFIPCGEDIISENIVFNAPYADVCVSWFTLSNPPGGMPQNVTFTFSDCP